MQIDKTFKDEWLKAVLNGLEEGLIIVDERFAIKSVNDVGESITGWHSHDAIDKKIHLVFKIVTEFNLDITDTFFSENAKEEDFLSCYLLNKNFQKVWIEVRLKRIEVSDELKGYVVFFKKSNEEKLRGKEIIENERKYKGLFENAIEGIFIVDGKGNIVDANPSACKIYQFKKEDFLKLKVGDIFPHKSIEESSTIWKEFLQNGYLEGFYKYKVANGEDKYIDFKVKANFIQDLHLAIFYDVTEQTKTGKALRSSEANLKAIFNNSNQSLILLDNENRVVTFNECARRKTFENLGIEMKVGGSIFDYGKAGEEEKLLPLFSKVKNGETIFYEYNPEYGHKPDYWIEVGFVPIFDNNRIQGILLSINDITFRKKAELNLAESEARFRSLVQNSSDIITVLNEENCIKYISPSIEKILGYKEEDLNGKNILDFIHEEERPVVKNTLRKIVIRDQFNPVLEYRFLHADGYYLYLETTCNNLVANEHIQGIVLNTRDITERKYQEENLLLLERAIDSSSNGIIISDPNVPDNPIIYVNKAFEQITGYNYLDIIGKNCRYLQLDDRKQGEIGKIRDAIKHQKEVSVVLRNYKKDGKLFWNQLSISPVFNRNKELSNFIGVINDITKKKVAEDTLLAISQGISTSDTIDIYESLVNHIGLRLEVDYVMVGEVVKDKIRTRGFWYDGEIRENIEYEIKGTPCEHVIGLGAAVVFKNVAEEFPSDFTLNAGIKSYMALPLKDSKGKIIGNIGVMSRGEFKNQALVESILNIFSVRASAELERDYYIAALKGSEKKFKDLATNSPDLIYIIDLDSKEIIYFNRSEILGYSNQELRVSEGWLQIVHSDDTELVKEHWSRFVESSYNITRSIEYRIRNKQGVYEWVTNRHIVLERNSEGKPRLVLLNLTVITERKNAENALKESEARLMALIENTNDVMWSVDANLVFTTMNSAFKNLFKIYYEKEIKVGDSINDSLPDSIREEWAALHVRTLNGEHFSVEFIVPGQIENISYEVSYNPIFSDSGKISGVSVFARDITQRKLVEDDIIRTNFELDSFVYRASHDLRAPLRSVLGLVSLAKTELDEKERATYLHLVEKSINKLDTFISDLTNFSRNSRLEVTVSVIDFKAIINECLENLKYMDNAERIKTHVTIGQDYDFYSDFTRINIILQNIISNSIKYQNLRIEEPYVNIDILTEKDHTEIVISDNGKGIKDEYLDKIFNMFFRASQESYGSGLGLYITKQVVEKLHGSISVDSTLGFGTEFRVKLPNLKN